MKPFVFDIKTDPETAFAALQTQPYSLWLDIADWCRLSHCETSNVESTVDAKIRRPRVTLLIDNVGNWIGVAK